MKKVWNVVRTVITWIFVVLAVCMMVFTVLSVSTLNQTQRSLFGYRAYIVLSDSMKATNFAAGDLVISKEVNDCTTLKEGDIISFISQNENNDGEIVTHKIRQLTTDVNGEPGFITYGTSTDTNDETVVTYFDVLGKYQFAIPGAGTFFQFLKTVPGYMVCILLPFMVLILIQAIHSVRLFRKYKAEQKAELQEERDKLAEQYAATKAIMEQLQQMKQQMKQEESAEEDCVAQSVMRK